MENNKSSVSYSDAYRIYTGCSFSKGVMWLSIVSVLFFYALMLIMTSLMFIDKDSTQESKPFFSVTIVVIYCSMQVVLRILQLYDKGVPGGKYFRTVKGGFITYAKAQKIFIAESAISIIVFCSSLAILDFLGIIELGYGIGSYIILFITVFLARAIASFSRMIRNSITRMIMIMFTFCIVDLIGIYQIEALSGKLSVLHLILAAVTVILTIISEKTVLNDYRKKYWNN